MRAAPSLHQCLTRIHSHGNPPEAFQLGESVRPVGYRFITQMIDYHKVMKSILINKLIFNYLCDFVTDFFNNF